jgi:hypothetical protein
MQWGGLEASQAAKVLLPLGRISRIFEWLEGLLDLRKKEKGLPFNNQERQRHLRSRDSRESLAAGNLCTSL